MKNILLTLMVFGSFGAFAEEYNYLICKPKKLIPASDSYQFNAFIKYFQRTNTSKVKEYPSAYPYLEDDRLRSGIGIQVELSEASPTESKDDIDTIWEFKTWNFFAIQKPETYIAPSTCCGRNPMFELNRKTLQLSYRSEGYSWDGIVHHLTEEKKCKIVSKKVFNSSLDKAKKARLKRNKKFLEKDKKETKI